jgi:hypothetical protein
MPQVKIKAGKRLGKPVTLAEVKAHKLFADSPLVRQGRLSVVPLSREQYKFLTGEWGLGKSVCWVVARGPACSPDKNKSSCARLDSRGRLSPRV